MIMELEDKDKRTFEDFLTFLQFHPDLKMWEIDPEPILSLPGLQIYPDRRKIYHGQQEIELNTKEFALLCLLVTNKGRVLTYGQMYEKVWKEAAGLRKSGKLLERFGKISCPLVLIQGAVDPHPSEGVIQPLRECNVDIKSYVLEQCGHTPWREKYAREEFARVLFSELEG